MIGTWEIESENIITGDKSVIDTRNLIVDGFYTTLHDFLSQDQGTGVLVDDFNISHVAIGDDNTPVTRADDVLGNEIFRKAVTVKASSSSSYSVKILLDSSDGNPIGGFIREIGMYCKGTTTTDSGTLISRVIVNTQKNTNVRLTLTWTLRGV